jgi:hypothetical protein
MGGHAEERTTLERAAAAIADETRRAYALVYEVTAAGVDDRHPLVLAVKEIRLELLRVKGDLEGELSRLVKTCRRCQLRVHWVPGAAADLGHWRMRSPLRAGTIPRSKGRVALVSSQRPVA